MKNCIFILIFFAVCSLNALAGKPNTDSILQEGKTLFRLEKAAWYGTDILLDRYKSKHDSTGGYVTYINKEQKVVNVFFHKDDSSKVIISFVFDSIPKREPISTDIVIRKATPFELDLITLRKDCDRRLFNSRDTLFKFYQNTSFNRIPLINSDGKRVFVMTGPSGSIDTLKILIGNDYVLKYNSNNEFVSAEPLHYSLLSFPGYSDDRTVTLEMTHHTHVLSDFISSTDICTLLLYKDYVEWDSHIVFSKDWVSLFSLKSESLFIMTIEAFKKIYEKDEEEENEK